MAHGVIFKNELCSHRGAETEGKRSRAIEFFVAESPDCIGGFPAVFEEQLDRFFPAGVCVFVGMLRVDTRYDFPCDVGDAFARGCCLSHAYFNGIHAGYMMNDDACWMALLAPFYCGC